MARPPSRHRRIEYDWLVHKQGGEYCKNCNYRPKMPYSLHIDHIDNNINNNHPSNKQLLCQQCNAIKELERQKSERDRKMHAAGGSSSNLSVCVRRASGAIRSLDWVSESGIKPGLSEEAKIPLPEDTAIQYDRSETRSSSEAKNELNQYFVEDLIIKEWNRLEPTEGLVYPRCVSELVRRLRETMGSGSDAAVRRYIRAFTSDGSLWWINPHTKRIEPRNDESKEQVINSKLVDRYKKDAHAALAREIVLRRCIKNLTGKESDELFGDDEVNAQEDNGKDNQ